MYIVIGVDTVGAFGSLPVSIKSDSLLLWVGMPGVTFYFLFCRARRLVGNIASPIDGVGG